MAMLFVAASAELVSMGAGATSLNAVNGDTLMAWINAVSLPGGDNSVIGLSTGAAAANSRSKLGVMSTGQVRGNGRCLDTDANQSFAGTVGAIALNTWYHIAASFDYTNKIIRVYVNGVLDGTSGVLVWGAAPTSATNSLSFNIGSQHGGGSEFWDGYIDDARVYNRLLSDDEIASIYAVRGSDSIFSGLTNEFMLNEGSPGVGASGAGIIKDVVGQMNGTPGGTANPTWEESRIRSRRKLVS